MTNSLEKKTVSGASSTTRLSSGACPTTTPSPTEQKSICHDCVNFEKPKKGRYHTMGSCLAAYDSLANDGFHSCCFVCLVDAEQIEFCKEYKKKE